jgi:copper chaperone
MSTAEAPTRTYLVTGMTCAHCVASVEECVTDLDGVTRVQVDLESGIVHVTGAFTDAEVAAAVEEAGYAVVAS